MKKALAILTAVLLVALILPFTAKMTSYAVGRVGLSVPQPMLTQPEKEEIEKAMTAYGKKNVTISGIPELIFLNMTAPAELFVSIPPEAKEVYPGGILNVELSLTLPDIFKNQDIKMAYSIIDANMRDIYAEYEIKKVSSNLHFIKQVRTPPDIVPGAYIFSVGAFYKSYPLMKEWNMFKVKEKTGYRLIPPKEFRNTFLMAATILLDIFVVIIVFVLIKKGKLFFKRVKHKP